MSVRAVLGCVVLAIGALMTTVFGSAAVAADTVKIGWLSSLTGPLSSAAIAENQGVQFAVEEINAAGGIDGRRIQLVTYDTQGDPTKAVNFAQRLAFVDKVHFVIGPVNSGESLATVPIVAKAGIPNLVIGTVDELVNPKRYPRAFRAINTNRQWIVAANDYALKVLRRNRIAIIGDTSGYGTSSAKTATQLLEAAGVKPVYTVLVDPNKTDLTDELSKARQAGADVVMPWSAATGLIARLLNARGDMGWDVPVVGHSALMAPAIPKLLNKPDYWANAYAAGYVSTTYGPDGTLPAATKALMDRMRPRLGGKEVDFMFWWVALGYDTVRIVEHVVRKAGGTDPAAIQKAFESTAGLKGVYADYTWGPDDRNGFPDVGIVMNAANSLRDGCFRAAPSR
jgi:branched-chain amino acid transport system substrate-binding protein